jgi:hypothetical protein
MDIGRQLIAAGSSDPALAALANKLFKSGQDASDCEKAGLQDVKDWNKYWQLVQERKIQAAEDARIQMFILMSMYSGLAEGLGGMMAAGESGSLVGAMEDSMVYQIGQKTIPDDLFRQLSGLSVMERGDAILAAQGWKAFVPQGSGWYLGIGKTFGTGPTPAGWVGTAVAVPAVGYGVYKYGQYVDLWK